MSQSQSIISEDVWLVQCLFLAAFGAALYFGTSSGWIAQNIGIMPVSANQSSVITSQHAERAASAKVNSYELDTTKASAVSPEEANGPTVTFVGLPDDGAVAGVVMVAIVPKGLAVVSSIDAQLGENVLTPKVLGGDTFAIDTTAWEDGAYTLVVTVDGEYEGEEIVVRDHRKLVIQNDKKSVDIAKKEPVEMKKAERKRVAATDNLNVRMTPNGVIVGVERRGGVGALVKEVAVEQGQNRWVYVEFESGLRGYVAERFVAERSAQTDAVVDTARSLQESPERTVEMQMQLIEQLQQQVRELQAQMRMMQEAMQIGVQ